MKIPFLIFLVSGFASLQLEPALTHAAELATRYARSDSAPPLLKAGDRKIIWLKEELADVQMDLMKVLQSNHQAPAGLESREAALKYALRTEQLRQDELAQGLRQQGAWRRLAFELRMPRL